MFQHIDSAYSERHMGMYDENVKAYQVNKIKYDIDIIFIIISIHPQIRHTKMCFSSLCS